MIEQQGKVVGVANGLASVRLGGRSSCALCDAGKGCGAGIFGRMLKRKPVTLQLENRVNAVSGQAVMVGIPESLYLRLLGRLYLLPLLTGLLCAAIGHYISYRVVAGPLASDMLALLSGLAGAAAVTWWRRDDAMEFPERFIVHLLRILEFDQPDTE